MFPQNILYFEPPLPPCIFMMKLLSPSVHIFKGITPFKKLIIPPKKTFEYDFKVFYLRYLDLFSLSFLRVRNISLELRLQSKYRIYSEKDWQCHAVFFSSLMK